MKEEMQRIYNAFQITDKARRKQNFAWGLHHEGEGISAPDSASSSLNVQL